MSTKIRTTLAALACCAATMGAMAVSPQLVFADGSDQPHVVKIAELSRVTFEDDGLTVSTTEDRFFPYSSLQKVTFDHDGSLSSSVRQLTVVGERLRVRTDASRSSITLSGFGDRALDIHIYSLTGALVKSLPVYQGGAIDVSNLPAGVYILKTQSSSVKFIK